MNSSSILEESFQAQLLKQGYAKRVPLNGTLELTFRCNYNCVHCYVNLPTGDRVAKARELSTAEWKRILEEIAQAGCLNLLLTGGEFMLRPDWKEIYMHARRQGMLITLYTNGSAITPEIVDFLAEYRPRRVEITLYGATKDTYEKVTRLPGSFEKAIRGINLLSEHAIPLKLKSVALRSNFHELAQMKYYTENLGLRFYYDPMINIRIDGQTYPLAERLSPVQIIALDIEDNERAERLVEVCTGMDQEPQRGEVFSCGAGQVSFTVDPFGMVSTCQIVRKPSVDLRQHSFEYAWNVVFNKMRHLERSGTQRCDHCEIQGTCTQCAGWSMTDANDYETPNDWLCDVNHAKHEAFNPNYQVKTGQRTILLTALPQKRLV
jgi:radical SAM protein with 4Fe4S-binding SPASM domain